MRAEQKRKKESEKQYTSNGSNLVQEDTPLITWMTNYSLILAQNFGVNL